MEILTGYPNRCQLYGNRKEGKVGKEANRAIRKATNRRIIIAIGKTTYGALHMLIDKAFFKIVSFYHSNSFQFKSPNSLYIKGILRTMFPHYNSTHLYF